eukprot:CAMPEP_0113471030 /NCGR_PEP_ID=MMETSP0014_2-20120614/16766_1 /TAXON_ID=2857 /ORGANISM="Nitzschia sp." /LENGTH=364 /DNA_ID=CAMNT_0000363649 /DNA_START=858 /DNA_END=1952 /DNA_ORIENTATION=- /assembly_acc=CAM_ASM_000159
MFVKVNHKSHEVLRSRDGVRGLLENKRYLGWTDKGGQHHAYLSPNDGYVPGATYDGGVIRRLKHFATGSGQAKAICCEREDLPDVFALCDKGKNGTMWLEEVVHKFFPSGYTKLEPGADPEGYARNVSKVNQRACCEFPPGKGVPLGPKGGNSTSAGAHQPRAGDPNRSCISTVDGTVTLSKFRQLMFGTEVHSVFWLFVPVEWFFSNEPGVNASDVICLGLWYFDEKTTTNDFNQCGGVGKDGEDFNGRYCELLHRKDETNSQWARQRAKSNFVVARMVLNTECPPPDHMYDGSTFNIEEFRGYKVLNVSGEECVMMPMEHGDSPCSDPDCEYEDVVEYWLEQFFRTATEEVEEDVNIDRKCT